MTWDGIAGVFEDAIADRIFAGVDGHKERVRAFRSGKDLMDAVQVANGKCYADLI